MYQQSDRSSDGKRSHNYSTAAPYIIPQQIMDQSKNLRTMIYKDDKSHYKSRSIFVDNYLIKSRYDNSSQEVTQYKLRPSLRPKISNKLHLQFPQKQKITVKRYVGEQKEIEQKVTGMFSKIFKCCVQPKIQKDYDECDYCEHRYYKPKKLGYQQQQSDDDNNRRQSTKPYISYKRLSQREKQPIQVFYQQVTNQDIQNNRFLDNSDDYLYHSKLNKSKRRE